MGLRSGVMFRRRLVAILMAVSVVALCSADLLTARGKACGPHACCAQGACTMMAKSGAYRFDRCPENSPAWSAAPLMLTVVTPFAIVHLPSLSVEPIIARAADGSPRGIDRPPRV